jgi:hypothetical protein
MLALLSVWWLTQQCISPCSFCVVRGLVYPRPAARLAEVLISSPVAACPSNGGTGPNCACVAGYVGSLSWTGTAWTGSCTRELLLDLLYVFAGHTNSLRATITSVVRCDGFACDYSLTCCSGYLPQRSSTNDHISVLHLLFRLQWEYQLELELEHLARILHPYVRVFFCRSCWHPVAIFASSVMLLLLDYFLQGGVSRQSTCHACGSGASSA